MKRSQLPLLIFIAVILVACEFKCKVGNLKDNEKSEPARTPSQPVKNESNTKTLNDIELHSRDVNVNRAFLALESGDLLPAGNTVSLGEKISLIINIDNGWKEAGGKSYIGASEKITTDNGTELLNTGDLFEAYNETGLDAADAKIITLKARISSVPPGNVEYYLVNYRVWDKKGNGEITGKYKFYIKL